MDPSGPRLANPQANGLRRALTRRRDRGSGGIYQRTSDHKRVATVTLPADPTTGKRRRKVVTAATRTEAQRKAGELRKTLQESADLLTKSLTDAVRRGQVTRNVAELVDPPRKAATERMPLTADETIRFLKVNASEPYVARYALGLMTGCRREALRLTCDNVQIDRDDAGNVTGGLDTLAWNLQRVKWRHGCPDKHPCGGKRAAERTHGCCPARLAVELDTAVPVVEAYQRRLSTVPPSALRDIPVTRTMRT